MHAFKVEEFLLKSFGSLMASQVNWYVFPRAYFIPGSWELMFARRVSSAEWNAFARSFMVTSQPVLPFLLKWSILECGQQPTGGTPMMPNLLAPSSYNVYIRYNN